MTDSAAPLPVIALVGRPNVGKSTLFNRFTRSRKALVAAIPGVTRDRREQDVNWEGRCFHLVDTGGLGAPDEIDYSSEIESQIDKALGTSDVVWLLVDAVDGLLAGDEELARRALRSGKPLIVLMNKVDHPGRGLAAAEFYRLGVQEVLPLSAMHGTGLDALLDATEAVCPLPRAPEEAPEETPRIRVAFIGKPNVGKSSLINAVLGEGRQIVSDAAGTTREAVEIPFTVEDVPYLLVDTAGLRRRARTKDYLDKIGAINALNTLYDVDVAVLVLDATEPVSDQDLRIAGYVVEHKRALVVALNKADRLKDRRQAEKRILADVEHRLRFVDFADKVFTSAVRRDGLERLFRAVRRAQEQFARNIQTADLNRVIQAAVLQTPPRAKGSSPTRIYYGLQVRTRPPAFRFFTNHREQITPAYTRFFEHQLRYHFGLEGTPLSIEWRNRRERQNQPKAG